MPTPLEKGINWGTQIGHNTISYYFEPGGVPFNFVGVQTGTSQTLSAYEMQQFQQALSLYATFLNVTFAQTFTETGADFRIFGFNGAGSGLLGAMDPPGESQAGMGIFNRAGSGWQESVTNGTGALDQGGYGFVTIIHELGHGLGLAHPHDGGGTSTVFPGVSSSSDTGDFDLNQGVYTTMSYIDGWKTNPNGTPPSASAYGYQGTPMAIDIAVLQAKYGANMSYHTGNDGYVLPGTNGPGTFFSCIWDAGGSDTISYGGARAATIDLRAATLQVGEGGGGFISHVHGIFGGFTIANGVLIENAVGGSGDDSLIGNDVGNTLLGNSGSDVIIAGYGNDYVSGGPGNDKLYGGPGADWFVFDATPRRLNADKLKDFSVHDDTIILVSAFFPKIGPVNHQLLSRKFDVGGVDGNDRIIYYPDTGLLYYDSNGSAAGGSRYLAHLSPGLHLTHHDFFVI